MKRLLIVFLCILLLAGCGQKGPTWQEQYDLGMRYLEDGDYEKAILAFAAAIEIDPKQPLAYVGRGDAYIGVADGLKTDPDAAVEWYDKAMENYEKAVELGSQAEDWLQTVQETLERIQSSRESRALLQPLYALFAAGDLEGAKALMRQEEYRAASTSLTEDYLYYDEGGDTVLAVYPHNCYYYGQWADGQRSGHGQWVCATFDDFEPLASMGGIRDFYIYNGSWLEDAPNGNGEIVEIIDPSDTRQDTVRIETVGSFSDGLYNGTIQIVEFKNDGGACTWSPITAIDGIFQPMEGRVESYGYAVAVSREDRHVLYDDGSCKNMVLWWNPPYQD